jgi:hypothetical protein
MVDVERSDHFVSFNDLQSRRCNRGGGSNANILTSKADFTKKFTWPQNSDNGALRINDGGLFGEQLVPPEGKVFELPLQREPSVPRSGDHVARTIKKGAHVLVEALWSARSTNSPTAKERSRKPRRLRRGPFALTSCAGSIVTSSSQKRLPRARHRKPTWLRSDSQPDSAPTQSRGLFFFLPSTRNAAVESFV